MARLLGCLLVCLAAFAMTAVASAQGAPGGPAAERDAARCEQAVLVGARRGGAPADVLHAIALTETGRALGGRLRPWPWAINREGVGHWFATRDEALAFARASVAAGRRSFDVGCFQINYHWHGHAFESLEAMFDPEVAATYAAQFLRSLREELGGWSPAAGAYHSRTPAFAARYRARFDRIHASLGGSTLVAEALEPLQPAPAEDVAPRRSRTRLTARPKVVTIGAAAAEVAAILAARGRLPPALDPARRAQASLVVSTRSAPF